MEKIEFITRAKKMGMTDSSIQEFLKYYSELEKEGNAYPLEDFFKSALSEDEIDFSCAETPYSTCQA